jgi:hypothetical protein
MNSHSLETAFTAIAVVTALIAAMFRWLSAIKLRGDLEVARRWFDARWNTIATSSWSDLPERVLQQFLGCRDKLVRFCEVGNRRWLWLCLISSLFSLFLVSIHFFQFTFLYFLDIFLMYMFIGLCFKVAVWMHEGRYVPSVGEVPIFLSMVLVPAIVVAGLMPLWQATLFLVTASPFLGMVAGITAASVRRRKTIVANSPRVKRASGKSTSERKKAASSSYKYDSKLNALFAFGLGAAGSLAYTCILLCLGRFLAPYAGMPNRVQAMLSNLLFDGLTTALTFRIVEVALASSRGFRIPAFVALLSSVSLALAYASLWLGTVVTGRASILYSEPEVPLWYLWGQLRDYGWLSVAKHEALPLQQLTNIITGRSPFGNSWEFGSMFLVANSVFLPLLMFLVAVCVCWLAKAVLNVSLWYFGRARHSDINPFAMNSALLGLIATIFGLASLVLRLVQS